MKFLGAQSFAHTGSLAIPYDGVDFDPHGVFRPIIHPFSKMDTSGRQIPVFSVTFMLICGLFYFLFGHWGPSMVPVLGGIFLLLSAWYMWIRHRKTHDGRMFLLVLGLGSPVLFYTQTLWEYTFAMGLVTAAFTTVCRGRVEKPKSIEWEPIISGFLIIFAAAFRTEAILFVPGILIFWRMTSRSLDSMWLYLIGISVGLAFSGGINFLFTGNVLPLHLLTNMFGDKFDFSLVTLTINKAHNFYVLLVEGFPQNHFTVFGVIPFLILAFWRRWRYEGKYWYGVAAVIIIVWGVYLTLSILPSNRAAYMAFSGGLIWVVPISILGLIRLKGERRRFWFLIYIASLIFVLIVGFTSPFVRGVHWGPRFILLIIPFILLIAAARAQRWCSRYPVVRPVIIILVIMGLVNQANSISVLWNTKQQNKKLTNWVATSADNPSLTNMWWLPSDVALIDMNKAWYSVGNDPRDIQNVLKGLRRRGIEKVNFFEKPPYIDKSMWWRLGAEPMGTDKLDVGGTYKGVRRLHLMIIQPK